MADRSTFTDEEWEQLRKGVTGAALLVSLGDRGFFDTFKEAGALAKHLAQARREGHSELLRDLAEGRGTGFGVTARPDEVESEALSSLRGAIATLEAKAPEDVDDYRRFVLDVSESVAEAAGGVEPGETGALTKIRSALGAA